MHAAIIAREVRRSIPGAKLPKLDAWLLRDPLERLIEANKQVLGALSVISNKTTPEEASKKLRKARKIRSALKAKRRGHKR